jgi:demethylmenaquinone methyltransferase/2-methoxy-6-polyprenyl-1,4-benzoquinol methylase
MSLAEEIGTPEGKGRYVRRLFGTIADRYDLITRVLSYGLDRRWKRRLIDLAAPEAGRRALDLATGTGDLAYLLHGRSVRAVGLDVTPRMIELARSRVPAGSPAPAFLVGDMTALPFASASFDLVTTGYGLRNVPDMQGALDEMIRVLKPGGRVCSLDVNRPSNALVRGAYRLYLSIVGGVPGWILHRDPDTYRYIPASIRTYPGAEAVALLMRARGLIRVDCRPVLGGLMAIHRGEKPHAASPVPVRLSSSS